MRFLLKEKPDKDGMVRLRGKDYHYLVNVRRLVKGSVFKALLPADGNTPPVNMQVSVTVTGIDNSTLSGSVVPENKAAGQSLNSPQDLPEIILFQALAKGQKMDLIVRQAAETGITEIVPFESEHSVPKKSSRDGRTERWRRIIKEARQQSGSGTETKIQNILGADELFAYWDKLYKPIGLIFHPCEAAMNCNGVEKGSFHGYLNKKPTVLVLAVGPEGGFSPAEIDRFAKAGFKALSLGSTILRTETAALFGAAAAKIILMERAWWKVTQQ